MDIYELVLECCKPEMRTHEDKKRFRCLYDKVEYQAQLRKELQNRVGYDWARTLLHLPSASQKQRNAIRELLHDNGIDV